MIGRNLNINIMKYFREFSSKKELLDWLEKSSDNVDWDYDVRLEYNIKEEEN